MFGNIYAVVGCLYSNGVDISLHSAVYVLQNTVQYYFNNDNDNYASHELSIIIYFCHLNQLQGYDQ